MKIETINEPAGDWGWVCTEMAESYQQWINGLNKSKTFIDKVLLYDIKADYADITDKSKPEGSYKKMIYFIRYKILYYGDEYLSDKDDITKSMEERKLEKEKWLHEIVEWDYMGHRQTEYPNSNQRDWNQTLVTKFNMLGARLHGLHIKPINGLKVLIPNKFRELIEDLEYFDKETNMLCGRFSIWFTEEDSDIIDIGTLKLKIINYELSKN